MAAQKKNLEQLLNDLESIVANLGAAQVPLDEALSLYEKGIKIAQSCQSVLEKAEQKIAWLSATEQEPSDEDE
ncbi:MAG: exodeoxyribonuclease VII small subunit [Pseudomonadota bacterium]